MSAPSPSGWTDICFDFSDRHVMVTGGTSGIGRAIARAYRRAGAHVTVTGTRASAAEYQDGTDSDALSDMDYRQLDVTDGASAEQVAKSLSRLDMLVNCAGVAMARPGDQYDPLAFDQGVLMHLTGVYRLSHACRDLLSESEAAGGASLLCVTSTSAYFGHATVPGYSAGKAGLTQLVKTLAIAWADRGIRVNAIAPGLTRSRMTTAAFDNPELGAPTLGRTPLGRLGEPEDMAGAALFLTSSAAAFITGQALPVDGGFTIRG